MNKSLKILRSALFMPASNARAIEKAAALPADAIIFDLEDSVSMDLKAEARAAACAAVKNGGTGDGLSVIRINGLDTSWGEADLADVINAKPDAVLVPKVNSADDVKRLSDQLEGSGIDLWVMIETARSILNIQSIADSAQETCLTCFIIGTNDLAKETRMQVHHDREALVPALTQCVFAARASGIQVLDSVFNDFKNAEAFKSECLQGKRFGMDGKSLIHPTQIETCNDVFAPSLDELQAAKRIVEVFEQPENASANVVSIDGKMVERLHLEMASDVLARGQAIGLI